MTNLLQYLHLLLPIYLLIISLIAVILTLIDKPRAIKGKWRIPEKTLILFGLLGGALSEWFTMLLIRHKTKHAKFMLLLPLFFTVHILLLVVLAMRIFS